MEDGLLEQFCRVVWPALGLFELGVVLPAMLWAVAVENGQRRGIVVMAFLASIVVLAVGIAVSGMGQTR